MNIRSLIFTLSAAMLPVQAEWEGRGLCHVWTGEGTPKAPEDMLPGVIYDVFQTPNGKPATIATTETTHIIDILKALISNKKGVLNRHYKLPYHVAAPHFYMDSTHPDSIIDMLEPGYSSKSRSSSGSDFITGKPSSQSSNTITSWVGVFTGRVIAPKKMRFRFCGTAMDTIIVRFSNRIVLETGFFSQYLDRLPDKTPLIPSRYHARQDSWEYQEKLSQGKIIEKKRYEILPLHSAEGINRMFRGITCGLPVSVEEGKAYSIEIIIACIDDGGCHFLLTQEIKKGEMAPLQLFRTSDVPVAPSHRSIIGSSRINKGPAYDENSLIWQVAADKKKEKTAPKPRRKNTFNKVN